MPTKRKIANIIIGTCTIIACIWAYLGLYYGFGPGSHEIHKKTEPLIKYDTISGPVDIMAEYADTTRCILQNIFPMAIHEAIHNEWVKWNAKDRMSQALSADLPDGYGHKQFNEWQACEKYINIIIPNPMENCPWLERATTNAQPAGFRGLSHIEASWTGTEDGSITSINVETGYRKDDIQIQVRMCIHTAGNDPADDEFRISSDSTKNYFAIRTSKTQGPIIYNIDILGETDQINNVNDVTEQILDLVYGHPEWINKLNNTD